MRTALSIKPRQLGVVAFLVSVSAPCAAQGDPQSLDSIYFANETTGWAAGDDGIILSTTDAGKTWTPQQSGTTKALSSVHFMTEGTGWAVGDDGVILSTTDAGKTWTPQQSGTTGALSSVHFANERIGWAVGSEGAILSTTDGGKTWTRQQSGTTEWLSSVHFVNESTGWAAAVDGVILSTSDAGKTWTARRAATTALFSVHFANENAGWAVGSNIFCTTNAGKTWSLQRRGPPVLLSVHFVNEKTGWAVGNTGVILSTTDAGKTWTPQESGTTEMFNSVYFANKTTGWAVGNKGVNLSTTDAGNTWSGRAPVPDFYFRFKSLLKSEMRKASAKTPPAPHPGFGIAISADFDAMMRQAPVRDPAAPGFHEGNAYFWFEQLLKLFHVGLDLASPEFKNLLTGFSELQKAKTDEAMRVGVKHVIQRISDFEPVTRHDEFAKRVVLAHLINGARAAEIGLDVNRMCQVLMEHPQGCDFTSSAEALRAYSKEVRQMIYEPSFDGSVVPQRVAMWRALEKLALEIEKAGGSP